MADSEISDLGEFGWMFAKAICLKSEAELHKTYLSV
jgi:hypothetical protein